MHLKRWFRWAAIVAAILIIASEGFSLLLRTAAPRRYLTARLESSFGRPVEVRAFGFSLLDGPRIEAFDVSVDEDPRFGHEYFLRAEQLTAGPRWSALLSGNFEFGTLSFTRPTLNLVRLADGHWNLESWLPAPATAGNRAAGAPRGAGLRFHLSRIEVDSGRINFRQDDDVRPFALEDVTGDLEQESPGRWQLDFNAEPMRPGVAHPQSGTVRIRGIVGGTASRLQPADLDVTLWNATIEDALRLARGQDYGMRGSLSADLHASIEPSSSGAATEPPTIAPSEWSIGGAVRVSGIHRWDFPANAYQPSVNLLFNALWRSGESRVTLTSCDLEAPGSVAHASGELAWNHGFQPHIVLAPSEIAYGDLLAWYRALHSGVDDDLSIEGWLRAQGTAEDWPPRLTDASIESAGARIVPVATIAPLRFSPWSASLQSGAVNSSVVAVEFERAPGAAYARANPLRIQASILLPSPGGLLAPDAGWRFRVAIDGAADRVQDYLALGREFGGSGTRGWTAQGALVFHLSGEGNFHRGATDWQGTIESRALALQFAFLNQPVILPGATLSLGAGAAQKLTLAAAQAFDAHWSGTISRSAARPGWQFDLTADRLDAVALDRWIEPRARPAGLLDRLGIFGTPQNDGNAPTAPEIPILARGRLRAGDFVLAPMDAAQLDADVEIAGRTIIVHHAKGAFAGGTIDGDLTAQLGASPSYDASVRFDRVDLSVLTPKVPSLPGIFYGDAAGELKLHATGIGRDALLDSLAGEGSLASRNLEIAGFNFGALRPNQSAAQDQPALDDVHFTETQAAFRIADRVVRVAPLRMSGPAAANVVVDGTMGFQGALDLRIEISANSHAGSTRAARPGAPASFGAASPLVYQLTGTFASPQIGVTINGPPVTAAPNPPPARGGGREAQR
jgi:uncharacterized protein involved in outer membrane biogenesis